MQIGNVGRQIQAGAEGLRNGPHRRRESLQGVLRSPPAALDQRPCVGGGLQSHARGLVLPGHFPAQFFGDAIVLPQTLGGLLERRLQGSDQHVPLGKRSVGVERDLARQRVPGIPESKLRRGESGPGIGYPALDALSLRVERGDLASCISPGFMRRPGDLLRLGQLRAVGGLPVRGQVAAADGAGVPGVQIVRGGRRRLRALRDGQVLVGAGCLARRTALRLPRGFQPLRALGFLCPERIELLADLVELGAKFGAPRVSLLDGDPALPCRPRRLVQRRASRGVLRVTFLRGEGALGRALRLDLLRRGVLHAGAERGGGFLAGLREGGQAPQRRQGRRDLFARGTVVGRDASQRVIDVLLTLLQGRLLLGEPSLDGGDGRQPAAGLLRIQVLQPFDDAGGRLLRLVGREHGVARGGCRPLVPGCRRGAAAGRLQGCLELLPVRGRIVRVLRRGLLELDPQRLGLPAGRAGQLARRLQLVGAPYLPQDPAAVARLVLDQQAREAALRQNDGAQEGVAVEPQQLHDAFVDALHLLDLLDRRAVVADAPQDGLDLPDVALAAAAQRAGHLPGLAGHPEPQHDAQVGRRVVHQLLVGARRERRLSVQGIGDRLQDGRLARPGVADDGEVVAAGEVDGRRAGSGVAVPPRRGSERPQPFDGQMDRAHVRSPARRVSRRAGRASPARSA